MSDNRLLDHATTQYDGQVDILAAAEDLAERIPDALAPLARVAYNYRWAWTPGGPELFRGVDSERFDLCMRNPVRLLQESPARVLKRAAQDGELVARAQALEAEIAADLERPYRAGPRGSRPSRRLPLRRVRRARLAARLLGRTGGAGRRPAQGGLRPGGTAGRRRADVPQGLLPPADRRLGLAARVLDRHRPRSPARGAGHRPRRGAGDGHRAHRRQRRGGAHLARRRRADPAVPAGHRLRRQRADGPLDHRPPLRRRSSDAAGPVLAARRRRDPRAARAGLRARRHPPQRGPRRAGAAGARPRLPRGRRAVAVRRPGSCAQPDGVHHPHAGAGGQRLLSGGGDRGRRQPAGGRAGLLHRGAARPRPRCRRRRPGSRSASPRRRCG